MNEQHISCHVDRTCVPVVDRHCVTPIIWIGFLLNTCLFHYAKHASVKVHAHMFGLLRLTSVVDVFVPRVGERHVQLTHVNKHHGITVWALSYV